jgi:hypothetical protein
MLLDGAIDPQESPTDRQVHQYEGFQHAFEAYAATCGARSGCPLGTDPAGATAALQGLIRPLIEHPVPVDGRSLSYTDAAAATATAL